MKRTGPRVELKALHRSVSEVESRFLKPHLAPTNFGPPSKQEVLDVAAYVVLVHGAIEGFAEALAHWVLKRAVSNWVSKKKATRSTVSLALYQKPPSDSEQRSVYDNIREALDDAKRRLSSEIHENHGVSLRHLRAMFMPLGVNVPSDPVLTASLDLLITMRHQWAHHDHRHATVLKSARDAQITVSDCLALAAKLSAEVAAAKP